MSTHSSVSEIIHDYCYPVAMFLRENAPTKPMVGFRTIREIMVERTV